jgi:hypothetical protein
MPMEPPASSTQHLLLTKQPYRSHFLYPKLSSTQVVLELYFSTAGALGIPGNRPYSMN